MFHRTCPLIVPVVAFTVTAAQADIVYVDAEPLFANTVSNCCIPSGGPGCDDPVCQGLVCAVNPFCCFVWDQICANYAADLCADLCPPPPGPPGMVLSQQKISDTQGNFTGTLDNFDFFGISTASLGDHDGDGVPDLAVGAFQDSDGGSARGAVWVLFLNTDGTVKTHQKISDTQGGFTGILDNADLLGISVASIGDHDGDGVGDLAVGAHGDDDGGNRRGAVWVLFLNTDGTVKTHQKISDTQGGFTGTLDNDDWFGYSIASLGDLDGDGVGDVAVTAVNDDDGGPDRGAIWVLFLNIDGTVKSHQKISDTQGGFTGALDNLDFFGRSTAFIGDLDGDGVGDLAVGAEGDNDGGSDHGAVWVLFLNTDGTVKTHQKISDTQGGFTGTLDAHDVFGWSIAAMADLDGDSVGDIAVGARADDDGGFNRGAIWVLFLNTDGTVKSHQKISDTQGGFTGVLDNDDRFGASCASLGDLDGDGVVELAVAASWDDDGGPERGAVWVLFLDGARCFELVSEEISCHVDGETFTYTVEGINSCTGAMATFTFTGSGGAVGEELCFTVLVGDGGFCCSTEICVAIPDCTPECDLDGDGIVDMVDFLALLAAWGSCSDCGTPQACPADFDGDCSVGILDLLNLLGNWG